jgi:hypothetical protein
MCEKETRLHAFCLGIIIYGILIAPTLHFLFENILSLSLMATLRNSNQTGNVNER